MRWEVNQWSTGFTANVGVTNRGAALNGWTLTWAFPGNQQITNAWNSTVTQTGDAGHRPQRELERQPAHRRHGHVRLPGHLQRHQRPADRLPARRNSVHRVLTPTS